jgi:OFA family oxalate/formate antiporter-like MFS transporter
MDSRSRTILLAAMLVTFVTGSIHAFSVFLSPFEDSLHLPRAKISLIYSFALIFLTVSVLFGYRVYDLVKPGYMIFLACLGAATGLIVTAYSSNWWGLFVGYSLLFGTTNGLGYGYVLQLAGRAIPGSKGFAMAAVTAAYAVGSVVFSLLLAYRVENYSLASAFVTMAIVIVTGGAISAVVMHACRVQYALSGDMPMAKNRSSVSSTSGENPPLILLWLAYGCSVFAGLMAIGHAAGIVQTLGGIYSRAIWGAVFIGIGSSLGGFLVGSVISSRNMNACLIGLPLTSALFLGALVYVSQPDIAIIVLAGIGFTYGALIAVYPYAISVYFGDELGPKVYGRIFTAWGFAGLAGPWSAGKLFDYTGNYSSALTVASVIAIVSSVVIFYISRQFGTQSVSSRPP